MPVTSQQRRWTVEEVYNLPPDGNRYEVVHGELLVTPSPLPRHQRVVTRLAHALSTYLEPLGLFDTFFVGPVDFFHETEVYVQPDLVVAVPGEVGADWRTMRHLRLVVEVLSPSSVRGDRLVKRKAYQEAGAETYWIADPDRAVVEVWHPGDELAEIVAQTLVWRITPEVPELLIAVPELFANLPGPPGT